MKTIAALLYFRYEEKFSSWKVKYYDQMVQKGKPSSRTIKSSLSTETDNPSLCQNRRQKVFNWGALRLCGGFAFVRGLDILKIDKNSANL